MHRLLKSHAVITRKILLAGLIGASCVATQCPPVYAQDAAKRQVAIDHDVIYGHKAGMALTFDVIEPKENRNGAAILFMVSGGWVSSYTPPENFVSDKVSATPNLFESLIDHGYTVVMVRHGSSPYFKVPDAVADVRQAVRFVRQNAEKWHIDDPDRLGVIGGSAGGHLSLMLGTTADDGKPDSKDPLGKTSDRVAAVVAWFPPTELESFLVLKDRFPALDFDTSKTGDASPRRFATQDDAPTLLIHGDKDTLVPEAESHAMHEAFAKVGVESEVLIIPGAGHGFGGDDMNRVVKASVDWFDKYLLPAKP